MNVWLEFSCPKAGSMILEICEFPKRSSDVQERLLSFRCSRETTLIAMFKRDHSHGTKNLAPADLVLTSEFELGIHFLSI